MFCSKCGYEIEEMMKFCPSCGEKIEAHPTDTENINNQEIDSEPSVERNTEANTQIFEEQEPLSFEPGNVKVNCNNSHSSPVNTNITETTKKTTKSIKKKLSTSSIIIAIVMVLVVLFLLISLIGGKIGAIIISVIQLGLLGFSLLSNQGKITLKSKWIKIIALCLAGVLVIPFFAAFSVNKNIKTISWSEIVLGDIVPEPSSNRAEIITNSAHSLRVYIYDISAKDYSEYVSNCKEKGFTIDLDDNDSSFEAFNNDGYNLNLYYDDDDEKMSIDVGEPRSFGSYTWPTEGFAKLIPTPKSTVGDIDDNTEERFEITLGNTPIEDYKDYVKQCKELGYTVDVYESEKSFSAKNAEGYILTVTYFGFNAMQIWLDIPEYTVNLTVKCVENLVFSKYDIDVLVDDCSEGKVDHGSSETFELTLKRGKHKVSIQSDENSSVDGNITLNITKDEDITITASCSSSGISVKSSSGQAENETTTNTVNETTIPKTTKTETTKAETVNYSTNTKDTVKNGNTGVYSYKNSGGSYDIYYIIDFDEGYVYYFCDGNGDNTCDRIKIDSGTLNDVVIITYHDGEDSWQEGLHFKWNQQPDHLIMEDHNHFEYDFYTTNLSNALSKRDTRKIHDY